MAKEDKAECEFTDRYKALGIPYPDIDSICLGECEGIGMVPVYKDEKDPKYKERWLLLHNKGNIIRRFFHNLICDGWHFVRCPDCDGTGKRKTE